MEKPSIKTPPWIDKIFYPFTPHTFATENGLMHYVDEGKGDPIVFVHGTPTWSFVWRQQIKSLSRNYRCIAPDHVGFGLSEKPTEFAYTPEAHAQNLEQLLESLNLSKITLVVHDFGGPIGLSYALKCPDKIKNVVVLNTWMWSLEGEKKITKISGFMNSGIGKFLYQRLAFSPRVLLPQGYHESKHFTKDIKQHYLKPLSSSSARLGTWHFAVALKESGTWFDQLWAQREKLRHLNMLLIWGEKDKLLPLSLLEQWEQHFPEAKVVRVKAGHFLQEEKGSEVTAAIKEFVLENL
ncbi:alpha/beta fold hydrolase [Pontibacter harenae]|uniref:alpha/beta fold hydrolase n=1 Tax=Pontibacter harenae TaxID=2894083 RepID=UPI001E2A54A6|nr:alpha/beta fold hydrolase [Pontibacter harenae]MCC9167377.1 alpha/beta fold hydrolase [Pontibacter harenae]